jgi:hypothetical protein
VTGVSPDGLIVHLRLETGSRYLARAIALEIVDLLHQAVPEMDATSTSVSDEGQQNERTFVLCGSWVGDVRCLRIAGHPGAHCIAAGKTANGG